MRVSRALRRKRSSTAFTSGVASPDLAIPENETVVAPPSSEPPEILTNPPTAESREPLIQVGANRVNIRFHSRIERARALLAKYGLTLQDDEWVSSPHEPVERVEKPIRMRVRRQCHRCQTTFGAERVCSNCQHARCRQCPRSPAKKSKADREARASAAAGGGAGGSSGIGVTDSIGGKGKHSRSATTMPSKTEDLVRKPIMQRVRRHCHECGVLFLPDATDCELCGHIRCNECPRERPKYHLYQRGHTRDDEPDLDLVVRQWKKPRVRVRWTCHACAGPFAQGSKICTHCNHERCEDCTRQPPKKIKPPVDPNLLRSVEEKLALLDARAQGAGAGESSVS